MPSQQYIVHPADLPYVPTIMRAPSPSSTIGTDYGPDETDFVDADLEELEFRRKCEEMVGINRPRPEEEEANRDPLVHPRPLRQKFTPVEEKQMFEHIMNNLRATVKKLEEEELFEQTAVKSAAVALDDPLPTSDNLDDILRGLMIDPPPTATANTTGTATMLDSTRFTDRSATVTPQLGAAATAALAAIRNMAGSSNTTPGTGWPPQAGA
ncbi:hypothetical protein C8Q77DRAFT_1158645 [Trametes polyzona]|nr:hypothetical protein C8Q77DRAFT_1158645 [Trametes polyzona]